MAQFNQSLLDAFYKAAQRAVDDVEALRQRLIANGASPMAVNKTPQDEAVHCVGNALQALEYIGFGHFNAVSAQLETFIDLRLPQTDRKLPDDLKTIRLLKNLKGEVDKFAASQAPKP